MKYDRPEDIPDEVVERMKTLKTYIAMAKRRARDQGIAFAALPDSEWRQIYWDKSKRRQEHYQKVEVPKRVGVDMEDTKPPPGTISAKLKDYLVYYQDPAPNDLITIQQLISMQEQLDVIDRQIAATLEDEPVNVTRWRDLSRIQKELSMETRQLQEMLGISRRQRDAKKHDEELSDRLLANISQAKQLLDDYGLQLYCPHCLATEGTRVVHGFVIHHFPEAGIEVNTRCPQCQKDYAVSKTPEKWARQIEQTPLHRPLPTPS